MSRTRSRLRAEAASSAYARRTMPIARWSVIVAIVLTGAALLITAYSTY
jgi:hypothetical protein